MVVDVSRSGYTDDFEDNWTLIKYRGWVASATRGKRGQRLLRAMVDALDAMPTKELITSELRCQGGVCALGALGQARGMDLEALDPDCPGQVAAAFDIAEPLAREIVFENDECGPCRETPANRWFRMRMWVASQIKSET